MSLTENQLAAAGKANMETIMALVQQGFTGFERLAELNVAAARAALTESTASAQALLAAKNPQEFFKLQAQFAQPLLGKAIAYTQNAYQIAAQNQQEASQLLEGQAAQFSKTLGSALEKAVSTFATGKKAS